MGKVSLAQIYREMEAERIAKAIAEQSKPVVHTVSIVSGGALRNG